MVLEVSRDAGRAGLCFVVAAVGYRWAERNGGDVCLPY